MTANSPLDFYFDFSSPYGYLANHGIDAIAEKHGRTVMWRPYLLGVVFAVTGQSPLTTQPLRGDYARRDFQRSARALGVPFVLPEPFPALTDRAVKDRLKAETQAAITRYRTAPHRQPPSNGRSMVQPF